MEADLYHQWELEQQEQLMEKDYKMFEEYRRLENQLFGKMLAAIDCLKIAQENNSEVMRESAIGHLVRFYDEHKKLKNNLWRNFDE
jgi:hypothetical protein